jgi:hypothetical protein
MAPREVSMGIFHSVTAARLILVLGILNFILAFSIFFSCRCFPGSRIGKKLMKYRWYQRFFGNHCYIWRVFWPSIVIHAIFAIKYVGWPR